MFADQDDVDNFVNGYCERASEVSKVFLIKKNQATALWKQ